jgi:hypothetical protein
MRHPRYRANLSPHFLLLLVSLAPAPAQHAFRIPVGEASQAAEKLKLLSFRGAPRAEESLFSWAFIKERFLASLGITK